ncbi:DUF6478 family protein [Paracoccus aminophilus]|uniref:Uncharacterized protein n=1 Tax=Paracoccus aminophilus JCM 7686 TaxID=1367847 RepID=S5Y8K9_PARAH|nr:DUF6478 family protein [Paracoccus aminophilus]AGT07663.1 hypothetical protein JCM7686_0554 [Paracoccus aminophilus JCM 7686]
MALPARTWFDRILRERANRRWAELADDKQGLASSRKRMLREEALVLRRKLDQFLQRTDRRAEISGEALDAINLPIGTDWRWRPGFMTAPIVPEGVVSPENGARLGQEAAVWHDCAERALILEQMRNHRATDLAPFGMRMEIFAFAGSFLSVSIDLPQDALQGLTRNYVLRLETGLAIEREMSVFARLNIANGPNTDQILVKLDDLTPDAQGHHITEFDLAATEIDERRLQKIWIDLIFERPTMNALEVRELFVSRHLRAEF